MQTKDISRETKVNGSLWKEVVGTKMHYEMSPWSKFFIFKYWDIISLMNTIEVTLIKLISRLSNVVQSNGKNVQKRTQIGRTNNTLVLPVRLQEVKYENTQRKRNVEDKASYKNIRKRNAIIRVGLNVMQSLRKRKYRDRGQMNGKRTEKDTLRRGSGTHPST